MSTVARASQPTDSPPLTDPNLYLDRELSLLAFQHRVLAEASAPENPLLERVKFLAIVFSNLDEFFMVRVAVLMEKARAGDSQVSAQLDSIRAEVKQLVECAYACWRGLSQELEAAGIELIEYSRL